VVEVLSIDPDREEFQRECPALDEAFLERSRLDCRIVVTLDTVLGLSAVNEQNQR